MRLDRRATVGAQPIPGRLVTTGRLVTAVVFATCLFAATGLLATTSALAAPATGAPALETLLLAKGDVPGLAPASPITASTPTQWVRSVEGHTSGYDSQIQSLTSEGFEGGSYESLSATTASANTAGVSVAMIFSNPRGARTELRQEVPLQLKNSLATTPHSRAHRFSLRSIPGSSAYTVTEKGKLGAGTSVFFISGHCFLVVGVASLHSAVQLADGAASTLYRRSAATCASQL